MWILSMANSSSSLFKRKTHKKKLERFLWLQKINSFWGWTWLFSGSRGKGKKMLVYLQEGGQLETKGEWGKQEATHLCYPCTWPDPQRHLYWWTCEMPVASNFWVKGRSWYRFTQAGLNQHSRKSECGKQWGGGRREAWRSKLPETNELWWDEEALPSQAVKWRSEISKEPWGPS